MIKKVSPDTLLAHVKAVQKERLLRLPQVLDRIPYKRSRFLALVKDGVFPKPIKLGARAVAWPESQIDAVVARLAAGQVV